MASTVVVTGADHAAPGLACGRASFFSMRFLSEPRKLQIASGAFVPSFSGAAKPHPGGDPQGLEPAFRLLLGLRARPLPALGTAPARQSIPGVSDMPHLGPTEPIFQARSLS